MEKQRSFGWRVNGGADGFEQPHGRFTMEVFFSDVKRDWTWFVWAGSPGKGARHSQTIVDRGAESLLTDAKKAVLRAASALEREALIEDQKLR